MSESNPNEHLLKGRLSIDFKPDPDVKIKIDSDQGIKTDIKTEIDSQLFNERNEDQKVAGSFAKTEF